jgi:ankyrin repeat protein
VGRGATSRRQRGSCSGSRGSESAEAAEILLASGADVNARNKYGRTALKPAEFKKFKETAKFLRKHGGHK